MLTNIVNKLFRPDTDQLGSTLSNEEFIHFCYQEFLGRETDAVGKHSFLDRLSRGLSRLTLIKELVTSPEYLNRLIAQHFSKNTLPNLQHMRPNNYILVPIIGETQQAMTFHIESPADYDWLEAMIIAHGYYDRLGIWTLSINTDKQIIAEIASRFAPTCCLELGCSTGTVLKLLDDMQIHAEGIEISHLALALAYGSVRQQIHFGDILSLPLESKYDLFLGMDVFEHLNPNKLAAIVQRCYDLLQDGGFLVTNIPTFGVDPIFGEVCPIYLEPWRAELEHNEMFSWLHVDDTGWPLNGHLIWAPSAWWQMAFEQIGFKRELAIEEALQDIYKEYLHVQAPGRRSIFVFSKNVQSRSSVEQIVERIRVHRSSYTH